jgi:hypothetical protein
MGILLNTLKGIKDSVPRNRFVRRFASNHLIDDVVMNRIKSVPIRDSYENVGPGKVLSKSELEDELRVVLGEGNVSITLDKIEQGGLVLEMTSGVPIVEYEVSRLTEDASYVVFYQTKAF